jgi:predicted nucleotidyltransferase
VPTLSEASLSPTERRVVDRLVERREAELGHDLVGVWLYGSRARGEPARRESDVDLMVIAKGDRWTIQEKVTAIERDEAESEGLKPFLFSTQVNAPEWLEHRRAIRSFFIQEVDRDKIVLAGGG